MEKRQTADRRGTLKFGAWEVGGWLGGGGAGDVYEVTTAEGHRAALKAFRGDRRAKVIQKYMLELEFMNTHRDYPGVLPFIDAQLQEDDERSFWYAMPYALPLNKAQELLNDPYEVVKSIATVAATLAELSLQGVHHRNIKPGNIYMYDGKVAIGDFAFIPLDETIDLTSNRAPSITEFVAPERITPAAMIDDEKADVYSLAKTLQWALGMHAHEMAGMNKLMNRALMTDPKARPNMARFGGELFAIFDRAELSVYPEPTPQLDAAAGRLNELLEGEATDETRRIELGRQARGTYAALVASTLGVALTSLSRVKSLTVRELTVDDSDVKISPRRAHLLHRGADAVTASVPGATLTFSIHAGFWDGIESDRLKVAVQREWGEANISMRIKWIEIDEETEVWSLGWQQTLRAARSARSFNDLSRQTTENLAVAYNYLSNWVERREMPEH